MLHLLDMEFHFLHNIFTDSAFLFNTFKILHVDKSKKIGCTKLLRLWGSHIYIYMCVCVPSFPCLILQCAGVLCGIFLQQYIREVSR